jgi:TBC1 domain family member 5
MPENLYFRKPSTQKMLVDILFVFCKLNPDVGYRQGMHEVLAPMLWVVERDAIDPKTSSSSPDDSTDGLLRDLFDPQYIEHDTFSIFGVVMQHAKAYYDPSPRAPGEQESAMLFRCRRIFESLLPTFDPELASHLQEVDVLPQIFLMCVSISVGPWLSEGVRLTDAGAGFDCCSVGSSRSMMPCPCGT